MNSDESDWQAQPPFAAGTLRQTIADAVAGDAKAWSSLTARYQPLMRAVTRASGCPRPTPTTLCRRCGCGCSSI
jgi:hypothetical protein